MIFNVSNVNTDDCPMTTPFDSPKLDRLLAETNVDLVLAVSKHTVQYLLG
jgi:hypothetical protein